MTMKKNMNIAKQAQELLRKAKQKRQLQIEIRKRKRKREL